MTKKSSRTDKMMSVRRKEVSEFLIGWETTHVKSCGLSSLALVDVERSPPCPKAINSTSSNDQVFASSSIDYYQTKQKERVQDLSQQKTAAFRSHPSLAFVALLGSLCVCGCSPHSCCGGSDARFLLCPSLSFPKRGSLERI